jgi:hypothetical protein
LLECWCGQPISAPPHRTFTYWTLFDATGRRPGGLLVQIVGSVEIDRPASQVWAYVADYATTPAGAAV